VASVQPPDVSHSPTRAIFAATQRDPGVGSISAPLRLHSGNGGSGHAGRNVGTMRISLRRVLDAISADGNLTTAGFCRLSALALQAARTIARLLRDKRAISPDAADGISVRIASALDELSTKWGVEL
jgi:hypothetical protein